MELCLRDSNVFVVWTLSTVIPPRILCLPDGNTLLQDSTRYIEVWDIPSHQLLRHIMVPINGNDDSVHMVHFANVDGGRIIAVVRSSIFIFTMEGEQSVVVHRPGEIHSITSEGNIMFDCTMNTDTYERDISAVNILTGERIDVGHYTWDHPWTWASDINMLTMGEFLIVHCIEDENDGGIHVLNKSNLLIEHDNHALRYQHIKPTNDGNQIVALNYLQEVVTLQMNSAGVLSELTRFSPYQQLSRRLPEGHVLQTRDMLLIDSLLYISFGGELPLETGIDVFDVKTGKLVRVKRTFVGRGTDGNWGAMTLATNGSELFCSGRHVQVYPL